MSVATVMVVRQEREARPMLRPTYTIQSGINSPVEIEAGVVTQNRDGTTAKQGGIFRFEVELISVGRIVDANPKVEISEWRVDDPTILQENDGEFTATGIGRTVVWCEGIVELPNGEQKHFLISEQVLVTPARKRELLDYNQIRPLPQTAVAFLISNYLIDIEPRMF